MDIVHHKSGLDMVYGELQALKKLQHPYIVTLHFAFNDKVSCFLVLDLLCGGDLRQYCKSHTVFDESHICFIGLCICSALEYMHSKYVLHRDVKPENILLDDRGYPYLTDFGVAYVHTICQRSYPYIKNMCQDFLHVCSKSIYNDDVFIL